MERSEAELVECLLAPASIQRREVSFFSRRMDERAPTRKVEARVLSTAIATYLKITQYPWLQALGMFVKEGGRPFSVSTTCK